MGLDGYRVTEILPQASRPQWCDGRRRRGAEDGSPARFDRHCHRHRKDGGGGEPE